MDDEFASTAVEILAKHASARELRKTILDLVDQYVAATEEERPPFKAGRSTIRYAGRVHDEHEVHNLVDAALEFWLTEGKYGATRERIDAGSRRRILPTRQLWVVGESLRVLRIDVAQARRSADSSR